MYSVFFTDNQKFIFTKEQILLIPYFNMLLTSQSNFKKYSINIPLSSIGFEYIHMYVTMGEIDIIDPLEKYLFVIKQCDYFGYDKLKILLEYKYGYKTDIYDITEKIGTETTIKIKYLGKISIKKRNIPILTKKTICSSGFITVLYRISGTIIDDRGREINHIKQDEPFKISPEYSLYNIFNKIYIEKIHTHSPLNNDRYSYYVNNKDIGYHNFESLFNINNSLYVINPIYEYQKYSSNVEINKIYETKYILKYNTYFVKMIQNILLFDKNNIICVKIKDEYKLLSNTIEDEYKNIECIIMENEPKFNDKYFIKYIDNNLEIYEYNF